MRVIGSGLRLRASKWTVRGCSGLTRGVLALTVLWATGLPKTAFAQSTSSSTDMAAQTQDAPPARPPWALPSAAEVAAHRPAPLPSLRVGITLTAEQEAAMEAAREQFRPQLHALFARWQQATGTGATVTAAALQDSVQQVLLAQRSAVLTLLTPTQRTQYEANELRLQPVGDR
jgi:hypothetical protein